MRFTQIARFEIGYQLKQPLFRIIFAIFFLLTFGAVTVQQIQVGSGANVLKNSPFAIAQIHLVFALFFMFVTTAFVANVIVRDDETGFGPILRSTPVHKAEYLYGRFVGAYLVSALCFLSVPLAIAIGSLMPWVDPHTLGPIVFSHYAYAYFVFALPTLFVTSAAFFALATVARSMMATYLGVVAFFVAFVVMTVALKDPSWDRIVAVAEPFGLGAFGQATRYWTASDRNTLMPPLEGLLLWNRLLWIGISFVFLAAAYVLFRFEERPHRARKLSPQDASALPARGLLPSASFGRATTFAQVVARTRFETRRVLRSPAFLVLLLLGVFNGGMALWNVRELYDTDLYPVTRVMIESLLGSFSLFPIIVAAYYAGELVWRERDARFHEITDATAAPDHAFFLPKTIALCVVLFAMLGVSVLTAIGVQLMRGYTHFELAKYVLWYLLPGGVDWALLAVLAVFLQSIARSKQIGWGLMLLYIVSTMVLSNLGFEHSLYRFGEGPWVPLSDMNGTGDFGAAANWLRVYWSAFAVLLVVLGSVLWRRGTQGSLRSALARVPSRFVGGHRAVAAAALLVFVGTGTWVFLNTNVWNEYRTKEEEDETLADMEKELLQFEKVKQPTITDVKLSLDLHPHEPRLVTTGSYVLENRTGEPLSEVHVGYEDALEIEQLEVEGAHLEKSWERFGYRIYRFDQPLAPGAKRTLTFRTVRAQQGFRNRGNTTRIVDNGTFLNNTEFAPILGMGRSGLLQDPTKRRKYGLPAELRPAKLEDEGARAQNYVHADWVNADITVTTDADQTPIAPGYCVSDETHAGRRTARFVSEAPILHFFSVQSAVYEVTRAEHHGVELAVYHDAQHGQNVDRMIEALKVSLDTFQEAFGPYQFRQARIVEFPAYAMFAQSFANTIPYSEGLGFIAHFDDPTSIDYVSEVTAHELGHQWWAHQIIGADAQGSTALSETLAQYSSLLVMERLYGPHQIRKFLKYELDRYLRSRSGEAVEEMPLVRVENQPYIHYQKGALVMYLLKERLGEETVNRALRSVLEKYRFRSAPWPTAQVLVDALRAEAGPAHEQLIADLFERITLYDLRVGDAKITPRADGRFDVVVDVSARKLYADGKGAETESAFAAGESFDIGLFATKPGDEGFDGKDVVLLQRVPLHSGEQELRFTVDKRPAFAGVDPYNKQIDRDSDDNLVAVGE